MARKPTVTDPTPATPPPAAVPVDLALLREVAWSGALSDFDRDLVRSAAIELEHLRAALAAAEREREAEREAQELVAERDAVRAEMARAREERDRLRGVLQRIDGGDSPCTDESTLRQWAYEALTLGRSEEELSNG